MDKVLYLFPDTNLFIQCRSLDDLDWSAWSEFAEVHLIVSRLVQREIDNQKYRGNDRVGRRARKANQLFRRIIDSEQNHVSVREADPQVKLLLGGPGRPAPELTGNLDYTQADDAIVGHLYEYRKQNRGHDARLLTDDSGTLMTARALGLPFIAIPGTWLRDPEPSQAEKENRELRKQIARLRAGPDFDVAFVDEEGREIRELRAVQHVPVPLPDDELTDLMRELKRRAPPVGWLMRPDAYQNWLTECEQILRSVHDEMQVESEGVAFEIVATNTGTRPGKDVLVAISAMGDFRIRPHRAEWSFYADSNLERTYLPSPPSLLDVPSLYAGGLLGSQQSGGERRDPNGFYCKGGLRHDPVDSYALECAQWRHGPSEEYFRSEIFVSYTDAKIEGALKCVIHAENLPDPITTVLPVRIEVRNASVSVADRAWDLVKSVNSGS